jgi:hypothetical protein
MLAYLDKQAQDNQGEIEASNTLSISWLCLFVCP